MGREITPAAMIGTSVRAILADWTDIEVKPQGPFCSIVGAYQGTPHAGCTRPEKGRSDPLELARYMDAAAKGGTNEPTPQPAPSDQPAPDDSGVPDPPAGPDAGEVDPRDARIAELEAQLAAARLPPVETPEQITEGVEKIVAASGRPQFSPPVATPTWGDANDPNAKMVPSDIEALMETGESVASAKVRLTEKFKAEINALNNRRMLGEHLGELDEARLEELYELYHKLALLGDGR